MSLILTPTLYLILNLELKELILSWLSLFLFLKVLMIESAFHGYVQLSVVSITSCFYLGEPSVLSRIDCSNNELFLVYCCAIEKPRVMDRIAWKTWYSSLEAFLVMSGSYLSWKYFGDWEYAVKNIFTWSVTTECHQRCLDFLSLPLPGPWDLS